MLTQIGVQKYAHSIYLWAVVKCKALHVKCDLRNKDRIMSYAWKYSFGMACQTLHYSIFLYFYRILLHYHGIFWDLYLISGHFYSICFVSILYSIFYDLYSIYSFIFIV